MYKLILEGEIKLRLQEHFVSTDVILTQIGVFKCAFITLVIYCLCLTLLPWRTQFDPGFLPEQEQT